MTAVCARCGASLADDARFCSGCGNRASESGIRPPVPAFADGARPGLPGHRRAFVLGSVATLLVLGLVIVGVRLLASGGRSASQPSAAAWPASVATAFLADCGRTNSQRENYCECALETVEEHFSEPAYLAQQVQATGQLPESVRRVEAPCRHK